MTKVIMLTAVAIFVTGTAMAADTQSIQHGHEVFTYWCAPCHGSGPGHPGTNALAAKYRGSVPAELEQRSDLNPELIRTVVRHGISVMPIFRKTEVSDADLKAIALYLDRPRP
ncbi:MAG TPA: cytochrome c [Steroidobacteraceae bacterium]|nr:cytochrome c [Steroidobacteraceae bacterium]